MAMARPLLAPRRVCLPASRPHHSRTRLTPIAAASSGPGGDKKSVLETTSDAAFLAKLVGVSFAGAAAVKYGSLFLYAPFHPEPAAAAAMVMLPTAAYGAILAVEAARTVKKGGGE